MCVLSDAKLKAAFLKSFIIWVRIYLFLKNNLTSEGAVYHNVLFYQQLSIAHYQVSFYNNQLFWVTTNSVHLGPNFMLSKFLRL